MHDDEVLAAYVGLLAVQWENHVGEFNDIARSIDNYRDHAEEPSAIYIAMLENARATHAASASNITATFALLRAQGVNVPRPLIESPGNDEGGSIQ